MIIKGQAISGWKRHATHLLKENKARISANSPWNDVVELICCHNTFASTSVQDALREMSAVAAGSKCNRWLYASSISPGGAGERELSNDEAEYAAGQLLDSLGFSAEHQWLLVRHVKQGRAHFHICASRIDPVSLRAVHLGWNYVKHEQVARRLEEHFNLRPIPGAFSRRRKKGDGKFTDDRPIASASTADEQQAQRTGVAVDKVISDLVRAWECSSTGRDFSVALKQLGYQLACGDRRDLVIVDCIGGVHSPTRRLGIKAADFRRRMADIQISDIPSLSVVRNKLRNTDQFLENANADNEKRPEREESQTHRFHQIKPGPV